MLVFALLLLFIFLDAQKHNKFVLNKMKIINKIQLGIEEGGGGGEGEGEGKWVVTGGIVWHLLCRRFITNSLLSSQLKNVRVRFALIVVFAYFTACCCSC